MDNRGCTVLLCHFYVDEEVALELSVLIDGDFASMLNTQSPKLEDILILHLDGGKDFFVSIIGNYLISCFGSSLETLIHLHTYIREVPTAQLLDLTMVRGGAVPTLGQNT